MSEKCTCEHPVRDCIEAENCVGVQRFSKPRNELAALKRQRDMLLDALKPFANEANKYDPDEGDSSQRIWDTTLMIGHLREARVAIAAVGGREMSDELSDRELAEWMAERIDESQSGRLLIPQHVISKFRKKTGDYFSSNAAVRAMIADFCQKNGCPL